MITILSSIWWLLVLLGVMILIHEAGHFWAARLFDVRVDIFSIGFGPRLFGFKRGDTDYRFSAILFGGYVKMAGEQPGDETVHDPRGFLQKPRWQRLIVVFAGPLMNIVLAVALLTGLYMFQYQHEVEPGGAIVGQILPGSPAEKAGIRPGDKITQIEGQKNPTWLDIQRHEIANAGRRIGVTAERDGKQFETSVVPVVDERYNIAISGWDGSGDIIARELTPGMPAQAAGIKPGDDLVSIDGQPIHAPFKLLDEIRKRNGAPVTLVYRRRNTDHTVEVKPVMSASGGGKARWMIGLLPDLKLNVVTEKLSLPAALRASLIENQQNASLIFSLLRSIIERRMSPKTLDGPIRIAQASSQAAQLGPGAFLNLMSVVSLNLAIFNLLPIPILDGGVILMLLVETLLGRDLSNAFKEGLLKVGFVFLMAVVVFVLYNDISKVLTQG